jgi:four helix bundle protein
MEREYDLEERLVNFGLEVMEIVEALPNTKVANLIAGQLLRSGTSPAFNYGEAQVAESNNDFIHKMSICIKELKETSISFLFIIRKPMLNELQNVISCHAECIELLKIFKASIKTARSKKN